MNIENLKILSTFLLTVEPAGFDMLTYARLGDEGDIPLLAHECKTAGCAVGWAPAAGIPPLPSENDWADYSERVFGLKCGSIAWQWCFGSSWAYIDNTPQGAAKRINHLIEHGVPADGWGGAPWL